MYKMLLIKKENNNKCSVDLTKEQNLSKSLLVNIFICKVLWIGKKTK